eukprot:4804162-Prymnesium_polylepis.1
MLSTTTRGGGSADQREGDHTRARDHRRSGQGARRLGDGGRTQGLDRRGLHAVRQGAHFRGARLLADDEHPHRVRDGQREAPGCHLDAGHRAARAAGVSS